MTVTEEGCRCAATACTAKASAANAASRTIAASSGLRCENARTLFIYFLIASSDSFGDSRHHLLVVPVHPHDNAPWPALVPRRLYFGVAVIENFVARVWASEVQEEPLFKEAVYVLPIVHPAEPVSLFEAVAAQVKL